MKVYWYKYNSGKGNFGDELTPYLLSYCGIRYEWAAPEHAEMFGIGSLIHFIPDDFKGVVWSTGMLSDSTSKDLSKATVLGLRGKLSMGRVVLNPKQSVCLGDGGLICDLFYKPLRNKHKLGIIPHYVNARNSILLDISAKSSEIKIIDICAGIPEVIKQVGECEHILSSSLHGLILADSLGVPNNWIEFTQDDKQEIIGKGFKFRDYYSNFGMSTKQPIILNQNDTLNSLLPLLENYERPEINNIKKNLKESFLSMVSNAAITSKHFILNTTSREIDLLSRINSIYFPRVIKDQKDEYQILEENEGGTLKDFIQEISKNLEKMECFFQGCLNILDELKELRIVHRQISMDNLVYKNGIPMLINFGWGLDYKSVDIEDGDWQEYFQEDVVSMGNILKQINHQRYPLIDHAIRIMTDARVSARVSDIDLFRTLFDHVFKSVKQGCNALDESCNDGKLNKSSDVVCHLLNKIELIDNDIKGLESEVFELRSRLYSTSSILISFEINKVVQSGEAILLVDEDALVGQLSLICQCFPYTEKDGYYNGPPKDEAAAIHDMKLQAKNGVHYVVIAWPAFWWLDYYKGWHQYLRSTYSCVLENERLVVFDLRQQLGV